MDANGLETAEDNDMMEYEGEKIVTMMDVLQQQEEFEEDANAVLGASDDKNCTYPKGYIKRQAVYACLTCCSDAKTDPTKRAGVCLACSLNCHENHELIELYTRRNFRCDCGNPKFNSHPCQYTENKTDLNEDNKYNQNFIGIYCVCHRPYPDPDAVYEDEMIQCTICEDWLHASHLEATLPNNDQYSEMICKACMEMNNFLHDYSYLAVNINGEDVDIISINETRTIKPNVEEKSEKIITSLSPHAEIVINNDITMKNCEKNESLYDNNIDTLNSDKELIGVVNGTNIIHGIDIGSKIDTQNIVLEKENAFVQGDLDTVDAVTADKTGENTAKESIDVVNEINGMDIDSNADTDIQNGVLEKENVFEKGDLDSINAITADEIGENTENCDRLETTLHTSKDIDMSMKNEESQKFLNEGKNNIQKNEDSSTESTLEENIIDTNNESINATDKNYLRENNTENSDINITKVTSNIDKELDSVENSNCSIDEQSLMIEEDELLSQQDTVKKDNPAVSESSEADTVLQDVERSESEAKNEDHTEKMYDETDNTNPKPIEFEIEFGIATNNFKPNDSKFKTDVQVTEEMNKATDKNNELNNEADITALNNLEHSDKETKTEENRIQQVDEHIDNVDVVQSTEVSSETDVNNTVLNDLEEQTKETIVNDTCQNIKDSIVDSTLNTLDGNELQSKTAEPINGNILEENSDTLENATRELLELTSDVVENSDDLLLEDNTNTNEEISKVIIADANENINPRMNTECEIMPNVNEHKRKLTEDNKDVVVKKARSEDKCSRPKGVKRGSKGATFWTSEFRQKLCTCNECLTMYKDLKLLFLLDPEDTVTAYETLGKEKINGTPTTQYEQGLQALSSLDRVQQINALTEYNLMRDKLLDFFKSFKERKQVVTEEDIRAFFAVMKPKREPDGVYFCR